MVFLWFSCHFWETMAIWETGRFNRRPGPGPLQPEGRRERAPRLGAARRRAERPQRGARGVAGVAPAGDVRVVKTRRF